VRTVGCHGNRVSLDTVAVLGGGIRIRIHRVCRRHELGEQVSGQPEPIALLVNRFEVMDHTTGGQGRVYTKWILQDFVVEFSLQDEGRTLKVFLTDKKVSDEQVSDQ